MARIDPTPATTQALTFRVSLSVASDDRTYLRVVDTASSVRVAEISFTAEDTALMVVGSREVTGSGTLVASPVLGLRRKVAWLVVPNLGRNNWDDREQIITDYLGTIDDEWAVTIEDSPNMHRINQDGSYRVSAIRYLPAG